MPWVQVYEEYSEGDGYEHVNPENFLSAFISGIINGFVEVTLVEKGTKDELCYQFADDGQARRFIKRLGGINE